MNSRPQARDLGTGFALVLLSFATPVHAIPWGYFVDSTQAFAPRVALARYDDGDFTLTIAREYEDSTAARLLGIAEATYPPRDRLIDLSERRHTEVGPDSARTSLWWYEGVGVMRVPYAVTAGALQYYKNLTDRFRSHNFWGAFARSLFWTDLNYHAIIARRDETWLGSRRFAGVYVAQMTLAWGYDDGTFVPTSQAYRIVILAPDGRVLAVEGDGIVDERVHFSSHRGIGYVDRLMR